MDFDQDELTRVLQGKDYDRHKHYVRWFKSHPEVFTGPSYYDMSREDQMAQLMKMANIMRKSPELYDEYLEGGYTKMYNVIDYLQGTVS